MMIGICCDLISCNYRYYLDIIKINHHACCEFQLRIFL